MGKQEKLVRFFTIGGIVFLSGILAQLLAASGGGDVYLWPPAGVVVAVVLSVSLGRLGLLPVLTGAFLARFAFNPTLYGAKSALVCVFGLLLLGAAARWMSKSFMGRLKNNKDLDFLLWLFKVGPFACLLPAAFVAGASVVLLHSNTAETAHQAMQTFANVWLGHTLGVLLFCPLMLIVNRSAHIRLAEREDTRRALVMIIAMVVLVVLGNLFLVKLETQRLLRNQQLLMNETESSKFEIIPQALSAIEAVQYYVYASEDVTPAEFAEYSGYTARFPAVRSLKWVPLSESDQLPQDTARRALLEKATQENRLLAIPGKTDGSGGQPILFVAAPVFQSAKPVSKASLRGYVLAELDVNSLIQPILTTALPLGMALKITDTTDPARPVVIAQTGTIDLEAARTKDLFFGGRTWHIQIASTNLTKLVQNSEVVWLFRLLSVLIVLTAVAVILAGLGRTVAVLRTVRARTFELEERLSYQLEAEAALRQQEEDLNVTLQALGEAVITTDAKGVIVRMNRVAETLTGWSQVQGQGERASAVFCLQGIGTQVDGVSTTYPVTEALSHKVTVSSVEPLWMVSRAGARHLVRYIAAPLLDQGHRVRGAVLVFKNVSDEENEHAKVAQAEKRFRSIIERTPTAIAMVRGDVIEFINPRMRKLLGIHRIDGEDRVLGTQLTRWVSADNHAALAEFCAQDESHHLAHELEVSLKRYDSEEVLVRVSVGTLDRDARHQFLLFKEVGSEHQNRFDTNGFFNLSPDLICMADDSGYLKQVNPAFLQALGWSQRELLAQPLLHFVHSDDVDNTRREIGLLKGGEKVRSFVNRCQCKNGDYLWLHWKARIAHRGVVFAIARDVTGHMELHEQLKSENAQLTRELRLKEFALNARDNTKQQ